MCLSTTHLIGESSDSSLKDSLSAALSFWIAVRSSFKFFAPRTLLMNDLTVGEIGEQGLRLKWSCSNWT